VTVYGAHFAQANPSPRANVGGCATPATTWVSDTSLIVKSSTFACSVSYFQVSVAASVRPGTDAAGYIYDGSGTISDANVAAANPCGFSTQWTSNAIVLTVTPAIVAACGDLTISMALSGATGGGATVSGSVTVASGTTSTTFTITTGTATGDLTISYSKSGSSASQYALPAPTVVTVNARVAITSDFAALHAACGISLGATSQVTTYTKAIIGGLPGTCLNSVVATSTLCDTFQASATIVFDPPAATATWTVTMCATAGARTLSFTLTGTGSHRYSPPANEVITPSAAATLTVTDPTCGYHAGCGASASARPMQTVTLSSKPTCNSLTVTITLTGTAAAGSTTFATVGGVVASSGPATFVFGTATVATADFRIDHGATAGDLTLGYTLTGNARAQYSAFVDGTGGWGTKTALAKSQIVAANIVCTFKAGDTNKFQGWMYIAKPLGLDNVCQVGADVTYTATSGGGATSLAPRKQLSFKNADMAQEMKYDAGNDPGTVNAVYTWQGKSMDCAYTLPRTRGTGGISTDFLITASGAETGPYCGVGSWTQTSGHGLMANMALAAGGATHGTLTYTYSLPSACTLIDRCDYLFDIRVNAVGGGACGFWDSINSNPAACKEGADVPVYVQGGTSVFTFVVCCPTGTTTGRGGQIVFKNGDTDILSDARPMTSPKFCYNAASC